MNKPVFRVVGLDTATCDAEYLGAETASRPVTIDAFQPKIYNPDQPQKACNVTVRLSDILPALQQSASHRLAWIQDFADDPVVISQDLYDVLVTYQRLKRSA